LINQTQCNLKGTQKLFFIQLNQAASCCRSNLELLPADMSDLLEHWQQEHDLLTQGVPVSNCSVCWKDQAQGHTSYRQQHSHQNNNTIELWINNTCNQMCSYCSPKFSSAWQQNILDHGPFRNISNTAKANQALLLEKVDQPQWIENIREYLQSQPPESVDLKLLGGEPLMQIRNLQKLIDLSGDSIKQLVINTNLNPPNNRFLHWLLDTVPAHKLKFDISLDASPKYNHVPRAGFDSDRFHTNLELLIDKNINFGFLSVVSVLSIFDLPKFIKWSQPYRVAFSKINNPDCLDPIWLPMEILDQIHNQFEQDPPMIFQELYNTPQSLVDLKLFEQYNYLCQYFSRTGINIEQIDNLLFQQYWTWLKERQK
jgi:organic radical activating enzyme